MIHGWWKRLVTPPCFETEEQNRVAGVLHPAALATLLGLMFLMLARLLTRDMSFFVPVAALSVCIVVVLILIRKSHLQLAAQMAVWGTLCFVDYLAVSRDGIHDIVIMIYAGILVVAGLVFDRRHFRIYAVGSTFSITAIGFLELAGVIRIHPGFMTTWAEVLDVTVTMVVTAIAVRLFSDNLLEHVDRARRGESELRTQTERLRTSEEKFNKAFHHTHMAMAIQDEEYRFTEINEAFALVTGYSRAEALGATAASLQLWIDRSQWEQARQTLSREGSLHDFVFAFRMKSGEQRQGMMWAEFVELGGRKCTISTVLDITERKQAEEAVRQKEERFHSLFNSIDDAVFVHGLDRDGMPGQFLEVNDVACKRLGFSRQELLRKRPFDIDAPEGYAVVPEAMRKLKTTNHAVWEGIHVRKDGKPIPVEINNHLFDFEGNPTIIATVRDITERKIMADRIRKSEEHYRTLIEMLPYAVLMIDSLGQITYASRSAYEMVGAPRRFDLSGRSILEWVADDYQEVALKRLRLIVEGLEKPRPYEYKLKKHDGSEFWGEINASALVDPSGVITGLLLVCRDITAFKRAEEQLLIKDSAIESSISAISLADPHASIIFVNKAFVKLWGYREASEIVGRNIAEFAMEGEPETSRVIQTMIEQGGYTGETLGRSADGSSFPLQIAANVVRSKEGVPICFMASFIDITERKAAEIALRQSESSLQAFVNALPQPAFMIERNGALLVANGSLARSMGMELADLIGKRMPDVLPDDAARDRQIGKALETQSSIVFEDERDGRHFVNYVEPVIDPLGKTGRVAVLALDITERKEIERALQRSEQEYRGLIAAAHDAIVIFEPEKEIVLDVNQRACELYGFSKAEFVGMSLQHLSLDNARGRKYIEQALSQGKLESMITEHYRKDGSIMHLEINAAIVDYKGHTAIISIERDVTERQRMERALKEQEELYREAIAQADAVPYRLSYSPEEYVFLGEGIRRLTGYGPDEMNPEVWRGLLQEIVMHGSAEGKTRAEAAQMALRGEMKEWRSHNRIKDRAGNTRWLADTAIQLFDAHGVPVGSLGILQDITDRKQWEEQMLAALQEKEILLKEIHHRVKNNLQVVSSLLNLQATHLKDEHVKSVFKESQNRIRSMALVHEYLYRSTDLSQIKFSAYVSRFLSEMVRSYASTLGRVQVRTDVGDVMLHIEEAIPCGLIINELVSNSLKYAFPDKRGGEITVTMRSTRDGRWELAVRDDGIGLPEGFELGATSTLGMRLVESFVRQLRGTLAVNGRNGSEFVVRFRSATADEETANAGQHDTAPSSRHGWK